MGDLATVVGQGFYVAGAWGGGTCTAAGSATAAVTIVILRFDIGALVEQKSHNRQVPLPGSPRQRRLAILLIFRLDIGALVK
jgi:hypothetical protein